MCVGFNCKNNYFPIANLTNILLHDTDLETIKECKHYCIMVIDDKVELSKSSFNNNVDEVNILFFYSITSYFYKVRATYFTVNVYEIL